MIALGSDHAAFKLKAAIMEHLKEKGIEFEDLGCDGTESVHYPIYGQKVAEAVAAGKYEYGIVVCGTGIGISLAANRVPGIRAAVCSEAYSARLTREHNNANIICFGARVIGEGVAASILDAFLSAEFVGGRHAERVAMLDSIK